MVVLEKQTLGKGDVKTLPKAVVETVEHSSFKISKLTVEPGWKWSECIKPLVGTDSCKVAHQGVILSSAMCVKMDDGTEMNFSAGDSFFIPPGHDGWVVGDEPMVGYEFASVERAGNVWDTEKKE